MVRITHLTLAALCITGSVAARGRKTSGFDTARLEAKVQGATVVRSLMIGDLEVRLDSAQTLLNVQDVLGAGALRPPRNHDDSWSICYTVATPNDSAQLRLLSNEMGGPEHTILGFELDHLRARRPSGACPAISRRASRLITDNGLGLGMPVSDLLKRMGRPVRISGSRYEFEFSGAVPALGASAAYDISGSLRADVSRHRVTKLWVWYVKTT
jgi:hypothetical protein